MTTQATPDFNAMLADARKAAMTAQALADDYRLQVDELREQNITLLKDRIAAQHQIIALTDERDMLMSRLGEANQAVMEEGPARDKFADAFQGE